MNAILMSIQPKWVEEIASGRKTIEVRKTAPKCGVPFKGYIYCTKAKSQWRYSGYEGAYENSEGEIVCAQRRVIGEFICDNVDEFFIFPDGAVQYWNYANLEKSCLTYEEVANYIGKSKKGYAWHISDLKIYNTPKELNEFYTLPCEKSEKACANCKWLVKVNTPDKYECECYVEDGRSITCAPQSWQYVQELGE